MNTDSQAPEDGSLTGFGRRLASNFELDPMIPKEMPSLLKALDDASSGAIGIRETP